MFLDQSMAWCLSDRLIVEMNLNVQHLKWNEFMVKLCVLIRMKHENGMTSQNDLKLTLSQFA